jgi:hypothetical protein
MDTNKLNRNKEGSLSKTQEWLEDYSKELLAQWTELTQGGDSACKWLSQQIEELQKSLGKTAIYNSALKEIMHSEIPEGSWRWKPIMQNEYIQAGFLQLAPGASIPFHDHPNSIDVMRVLEGIVELRSYSPSTDIVTIGKQAAHLKPVNYQRLENQDISIVFPNLGNIHGLRCQSNQAILLDVQVCHDPSIERRWYFPLGAANNNPAHVIAAALPESLLRSAIGCQAGE